MTYKVACINTTIAVILKWRLCLDEDVHVNTPETVHLITHGKVIVVSVDHIGHGFRNGPFIPE